MGDILTKEAFKNAIALDMAIGGSSNTTLHLMAIAHEAKVYLTLEDFDEISRRIPHITKLSPAGTHHMVDLDEAGGISAVLKELMDANLIFKDQLTVTGKTLEENIKNSLVLNDSVIRPLNNPYSNEGGIAILRGNLAPDGAVVKQSAVEPEMLYHKGVARVFDGEELAFDAIMNKKTSSW